MNIFAWILAGVCVLGFMAVLLVICGVISCCMLSSMISQEEEARYIKNLK